MSTTNKGRRLLSRLARMRDVNGTHTQIESDAAEDGRFEALRQSLRQQHGRGQKRVERNRCASREAFTKHETAHGPAFVRRTTLTLGHVHGDAPVFAAREVHGATLADLALDDALRDAHGQSVLYVDTETTGLAGGSGTIPFLTGLSWFESDSLVVLQVVVLDPSEERAALSLLAERLAQRATLVSFNGKSFDWPLLRTRFLLGRVACPTPAAHLDLLHVARRLFDHEEARLPDRRLQTLERHVLGFRREHDLPGAEIPDVYRRFLRERDVALLEPILEHNLHDLVALPALLGHCAHVFRAGREVKLDAGQLWALAKLCARRGQAERALSLLQRCTAQADERALRTRAHLFSARLERKRENFDAQADHLQHANEYAPRDTLLAAEASLAYAKYLEHRAKRYREALDHAFQTAAAEGEERSARRVARLRRRCESQSVAASPTTR